MSDDRAAPAADGPADAEVVQRVLAGDVDSFQLLVRRHQAAAFRLCHTLVLEADAAADLVQDAMVRAFVHLARCREPAGFRTWLLRIVRNRALDYLRERRRGDVSLSDEAVRMRVDATTREQPHDVEQLARRAAIHNALARLSQPLREAFVLRHVEGLSTEQVAELLGTGVSAVKMRVQRARLQLQRMLDQDGSPADVTDRSDGSSDA